MGLLGIKCDVKGCGDSFKCAHPSDPACVRTMPRHNPDCALPRGHTGLCASGPAQLAAQEHVNHPSHYGGESNPYEAIKVIMAWGLGFCLGNTVKYISRAGKKDPTKLVEDLEKARWYLDEAIKRAKMGETKL